MRRSVWKRLTERLRPPQQTFRGRLTLGATLLCLGALAVAGGVIFLGVRQTLLWHLDSALLSIARTELASALNRSLDRTSIYEEYPASLNLAVGAGYDKYAQIEEADGYIVARTANLKEMPPLRTDPALRRRVLSGEVVLSDAQIARERFRAVYCPLTDRRGRRLLAIVALPRAPVTHALLMLVGTLGLALAFAAVGASAGARLLAVQITRPLERIAASADSIGAEHPSARLPEPDPTAAVELRTVTTVLNDMLRRVENALRGSEQVIASQRRFIADASHELRSPLSSLRMTLEVALRRQRTVVEYRDALETAHEETLRLCRLVDHLLILSRADRGSFPMSVSPCDLAHIAWASAGSHVQEASDMGVSIRLEAGTPIPVCADEERIREVLDNLMENALRYAPGGSEIMVKAWRDGFCARISVEDQGPGLTAEEQAHIFDRFYRTDSARARHSGGTGLGLTIARAIVDAHGGSLTVRSAPGAGAAFTVTLPADSPEGEAGADDAITPGRSGGQEMKR